MDFNTPKVPNELDAVMEDLSLSHKPLPFRQQKEKPLLKYSNSEPGPVYLYQNPDLRTSFTSSVPSSPARALPNKRPGSAVVSNTPSRQYNTTPPTQFAYVSGPDPYARPMSAKDLMTLGLERTKTLNHIMSATLAGSIANNMQCTNASNNTLFKPSKPTDLLNPLQDTTPNGGSHGSTSSNRNSVSTTRVISVHSAEANSATTQAAKEKFEARLSKPSSSTERVNGARPPSALRRPQSSTVRNPNYSPGKPYDESCASEDEDFKMMSDVEQKPKRKIDDNLNNKISKAITTLSRSTTNVKSHSVTKLPSSNESVSSKGTEEKPSTAASILKSDLSASIAGRPPTEASPNSDISSTSHSSTKHSQRANSATTYYL